MACEILHGNILSSGIYFYYFLFKENYSFNKQRLDIRKQAPTLCGSRIEFHSIMSLKLTHITALSERACSLFFSLLARKRALSRSDYT